VKSSVKRTSREQTTVRVKASASKAVATAKRTGSGMGRVVKDAARRVKASAAQLVAPQKSQLVKPAPKSGRVAASKRVASKTVAKKASARLGSAARSGQARTVRLRRADPGGVLERLAAAIPAPHVELAFRDPWQLLIAVILSAQSTDRRVNQVTPVLFERWPTPRALASAAPAEVEEVIKSTGFFRNKTKAIIGASAMLDERFAGRVPRSMDEMLELPGEAR
jgi:endonuclease-3